MWDNEGDEMLTATDCASQNMFRVSADQRMLYLQIFKKGENNHIRNALVK